MGKDRRRERVARSVGLALTAGMFSIVPTAFGAPIQDTSVATTAAVAQGASAAPGAGIDTTITSTVQNNVIGWKDFSVKKDETVAFDNKNYMNIVTGANTSEINGIVTGGGDVYVVNPNGIIFGKDAQVNVGNLYASTRYVDPAAAEAAGAAGNLQSVLAMPSAGVAADVVNLGSITATKVEVEGANIRFVSDHVSATGANVTLKADGANGGYIHVGNAAAASPSYTMQNLDGSTAAATSVTDNYQTVDGSNWTTKFAANSSGNFMLVDDIDATTATGFAPVASFSGKFDGMFHKVRNMTSTTGGGLFRTTANATIQNVGIVDATITGVSAASPGGALIGKATGVTTVDHVYSDGTTSVSGDQAHAGALIGTAGTSMSDKTNISYSYTTRANEAASKAMIGNLTGEGAVDHSYVIANYPAGSTTNYGFLHYVAVPNSKFNVQNSYFSTPLSTADSTMSGATAPTPPVVDSIIIRKYAAAKLYNHAGAATDIPTVTQDDVQSIRMYNTLQSDTPGASNIGWLGDISDTGGVHIDTATGKVTRPSWRIYEGRALPILTSMTRGIKTVDYRYAYYKKGTGGTYTEQDTAATRYNGGKNGGKDIPASGTNPADGLLYNARFLKIVDEDGKELQDTTSTAGGVAADGNIAQNKAITFSGDRETHIFYGQDEGKYGQLHATYDGAQQSRALLWSDQAGYDLVGGNISIAPRTVSVPQKDLKEVVFKKEYDGTANVDASKIAALYEGTSTNVHGILDEDKAAGLVVNTSGITGKYVNPDTTKAQSAAEDWDRPTSYTNADNNQDVGAKKYVHLGGTLTLTSNGSAYTGHDYVINPADAAIDTFAKGLIYQRTLALSTLPAASQKIYDGTADVMTAGNGLSTDTARNFTTADFSMDRTNVHGADDVVLSVSGKAKYVDKQTDGTYQETKKVGTHDIAYTGIKLTGATAGNYTLVYGSEAIYSKKGRLTKDSNWNAAVAPVPSDASTGGTGVLHQAGGKITPRTISRTDYAWYKNVSGVLTEQDATRQYNGHTSYTDPVGPTDGRTVRLSSTATPTALGLVGTDDIQFTAAAADFTTAQGTGSPLTKNVYNAALGATDGAQAVRYKVTVTGSDAENYAFLDAPTVALKTDGTQYDVYGKGTITPRELKVKAGAAKAVKPYDGDAKVKHGGMGTENLEFGTDDYIVYDDDPAKTEAENERYHLVAGDTDKIAYTGIYKQTGTEAAKDVNWDAVNHVVLDKDVTYTVTVKNGASPSANYTFVGAASAAPNQVSLDAGKGGRIEQRELTGFRMGDVEKFYDTTAELNGGTDNIVSGKNTNTVDRALKDATATGLVGTDKIRDVFDASKIQGAYGRTAAGTFTENEHVNRDAAQNVIKTAVRYAGTNGAASLADAMTDHNYTLAAGTLQDDGSFVQEKGGKIKPVTLQHVTVTADHATKVYDGNQNVIAPAGHESEGAAYFLTHHTGTDAGKLHAMTGTSNGHTVHVGYRVVSGAYASKDSHNGTLQNVTYKLKAVEDGDYMLDASLKDASGNYSYTAVNGGTITPKTVYASARRDPLTKVYDAKRTAGVAGDAAVTLEGLIDGTNASTAAYDDKNVGTGKTVTYEVKLDPATQALGNYYIVDRSYTGNDPANHPITQLQTMDNAITPASLTVAFGTPTKEYDGNTNIQNPAQINAQITGLLTGDSGVQDQVTLNPALLSQAKYNDANVGMGKPIDYTLELQGTDAGNYRLASATQKENPTTHAQEWHQTGYGVITKKRVAPGGNPFSVTLAPITKAYDGTDAVAYDHTGWQYGQGGAGAKKTAGDYVNAFTLAGIPLQAANGDYSITSAKYDSPNVGASSAEYTFKISDTIAKNYDFSALSPDVFDNGVYHYTASGASITPQRVVMTLTAPETTKVYNGLRDVVTNAQTNVTGTPVDLTPLVAVSKADQKHDLALTAGDLSAQYASKDVQFDGAGNVVAQNVTYKVNLQTNPQNYELYVDATAATSGAGGTIGAVDLIGKGKILQKEIRTITFGDEVEKTYDGTARVTENASGTDPKDTISQAASTAQSADFVNGETFGQIFDATKLKGYYGTGTNAANFQQDANVLREGGAVLKKTMQYMGRTAAGADADIATAITNTNYKMADGVTSIVQEKAGKIKPKQMNFDDAVKVDFAAIQKVYDGSTDVSYNHSAWNRQDTGRMDAKDYIHSVRIGPSAASMTTLDPDKYAAKAAYDSADAGVRTAHYTITLAPAAAQMFNNYELTTAPSSGVSYDPAAHAIKMAHAGQITPQEVVAKAERAATKVYDGTTNLV
ncbi:MAG: YDG domain-containing protein, partial [Mitsuokella sp.]